LYHQSLNPPVWSVKGYESVWQQWGLKEKPADFAQALRERYGLHEAPFDNHGLPLGLNLARGFLGTKGIVNNCLLCHSGAIAGQTIIGLGNASLDVQLLFEELSAASGLRMDGLGYQFGYVRGTIDPVNGLNALLAFRDLDLNVHSAAKVDFTPYICSDPPAWWLIKRKKTRDWTGAIDARSTRVDMVNLLTPLNSAEAIKKQAPLFADIEAFVRSIPAPRYPFSIDQATAGRGQKVFASTCARCHGSYGPNASYPDKIVPLDTIGTDPLLCTSFTARMTEQLNRTWFAQELDPDGKPMQVALSQGYQAPPLDGIWATAPYFHNSSAPTVYHVLNSNARPKIFTRSYRTGKEEYDPVNLGWRITGLERTPDAKLPASDRRKIYDTTQPGRSAAGHTFGDKLSEDERMAVIEYLKTL
jgi:hypothetical protein